MAQFNNDYLDDVWGMLFVPNKNLIKKLIHTVLFITEPTFEFRFTMFSKTCLTDTSRDIPTSHWPHSFLFIGYAT